MHKLGYENKVDEWITHERAGKSRYGQNFYLQIAAESNKIDPFVKHIETGDEKWISYDNDKRQRSWLRTKRWPNPDWLTDQFHDTILSNNWSG